jgi:hypothetical protein
MIQRRQSVFLFIAAICGVVLMFNPVNTVSGPRGNIPVHLIKMDDPELASTTGHQAAIFINFGALILATIALFMYNRRSLQEKLCYVLAVVWLVVTLMIAFCPFIDQTAGEPVTVKVNYLSIAVGALGMVASVMAARHIRKDIELLKSADRIR